MNLVKYTDTLKNEWNNFIKESKNGLFFFERDFMDYHADRFTDHSLIIYEKEKILAVLPANENGDTIYSHQGLTFGSFIIHRKIKTQKVISIFEEVKNYYKNLGFTKMIYKAIPYIFPHYPSQEDLYALFRNQAQLLKREISSVIEIQNKIEYSSSKKNRVNKLSKNNFEVVEENDYSKFWELLTYTLQKHHNTCPVHTLEEIKILKNHFPNHIRLFTVYEEQELLAGILVFDFGKVVHTQYMSNSDKGRKIGGLSFINYHLINQVFQDKTYYSFGISTENNGHFLNEGLIQQKEEMGGRGIVLDTYEIPF